MESLCKYKNIFGIPKQGIHSWRLGYVAAFDTLGTMYGAWLIANKMKWSYIKTLGISCAIGYVCHRMFCVETEMLS